MQPFVAPKECRRKMNGGCTDGLPRGNAVGSGGNRSTTATAGFRFSAGLTVPPALLLAWVGLLEGADDVAGDLTTDGDLVAVVACPLANQSVAGSVTRRGRGATLALRRHQGHWQRLYNPCLARIVQPTARAAAYSANSVLSMKTAPH